MNSIYLSSRSSSELHLPLSQFSPGAILEKFEDVSKAAYYLNPNRPDGNASVNFNVDKIPKSSSPRRNNSQYRGP